MRLAVLIIALSLAVLVGLQSMAVLLGSELIADKATSASAGAGLALALCFMIGGAFALGFPLASTGAFAFAAVVALTAAAEGQFEDLKVWGWVAVALSVMSLLGQRELGKRGQAAGGDVAARADETPLAGPYRPVRAASADAGATEPNANARPVTGGRSAVIGEIERLAKLRASGALTEDEYEAIKSRLLGH